MGVYVCLREAQSGKRLACTYGIPQLAGIIVEQSLPLFHVFIVAASVINIQRKPSGLSLLRLTDCFLLELPL